ncbi:class I SAM-dependent methyltransferase [Acidobacteriota bacterium]
MLKNFINRILHLSGYHIMTIDYKNRLEEALLIQNTPQNNSENEKEHEYCYKTPSNQTIADIMKDCWYTEFPEEYNVKTNGRANLFDVSNDDRVEWVAEHFGDKLKDFDILELGPFEGAHLKMFHDFGVTQITSIEANAKHYLKLLLLKEIMGLNAKFLHGDFLKYLDSCNKKFDLIFASGVLYHQSKPFDLIRLISSHTDRFFIHTHYYDHAILQSNPADFAFFSDNRIDQVKFKNQSFDMYYRRYNEKKLGYFCGGHEEYSYWLKKDDIFRFIKEICGFKTIELIIDDPSGPNGPAMNIYAEK